MRFGLDFFYGIETINFFDTAVERFYFFPFINKTSFILIIIYVSFNWVLTFKYKSYKRNNFSRAKIKESFQMNNYWKKKELKVKRKEENNI